MGSSSFRIAKVAPNYFMALLKRWLGSHGDTGSRWPKCEPQQLQRRSVARDRLNPDDAQRVPLVCLDKDDTVSERRGPESGSIAGRIFTS